MKRGQKEEQHAFRSGQGAQTEKRSAPETAAVGYLVEQLVEGQKGEEGEEHGLEAARAPAGERSEGSQDHRGEEVPRRGLSAVETTR